MVLYEFVQLHTQSTGSPFAPVKQYESRLNDETLRAQQIVCHTRSIGVDFHTNTRLGYASRRSRRETFLSQTPDLCPIEPSASPAGCIAPLEHTLSPVDTFTRNRPHHPPPA